MSLRILLIRPNISIRKGFDLLNKMHPPIGLAYLAAPLLEAGHEVRILDTVSEAPQSSWEYRGTHFCHGMNDGEIAHYLGEFRPDIVGITGFTAQHCRMVEIAGVVKESLPGSTVVMGGCHASAMPRFLLEQSLADFIILGEGEHSFSSLVELVEKGATHLAAQLDGIAWRGADGIRINAKSRYEQNLDTLPLPARQLLPNQAYTADQVSMPMITSRGCPQACAFCSIHLTQGNRWRTRTPARVVDEMEYIVRELGYEGISIFDDAPNVRASYLTDICKEIVRRNLKLHLIMPGGVMIKSLTKDALHWLKKAGCISVGLPFEHVDESMRNKVIHKGVTTRQFDQVLDWCRELEILTIVKFVLGMPGETEQSLESINSYVRENAHRMDAIQVLFATPFPGTRFFDTCMEAGYLVDPEHNGFLEFDLHECLIDTPQLSREQVTRHKREIEDSFLTAQGDPELLNLVRRAIRKPDDHLMQKVSTLYFPKIHQLSRSKASPISAA